MSRSEIFALTDLIGSKAIMKFYNTNLIPPLTLRKPCVSENLVCARFGHSIAHDFHGTLALEGTRVVGSEGL